MGCLRVGEDNFQTRLREPIFGKLLRVKTRKILSLFRNKATITKNLRSTHPAFFEKFGNCKSRSILKKIPLFQQAKTFAGRAKLHVQLHVLVKKILI